MTVFLRVCPRTLPPENRQFGERRANLREGRYNTVLQELDDVDERAARADRGELSRVTDEDQPLDLADVVQYSVCLLYTSRCV